MIQPTNAQQIYPPQTGANAVSINIYNPQAYGSAPQGQVSAPYNYQNPMYSMPQTSIYQPAVQNQMPAQQYSVYPGMVQTPIAPAPQLMPDSVMTPQEQKPLENSSVQNNNGTQTPQVEVQEEAQVPEKVVNTDELIQGLKDNDADNKAKAINKIAEYVQSEPEVALQVVSQPIMNALVNIINEDTTALEGPTQQQVDVADKIAKGEQLTPEENAISEELSPRDKANKNRIFALYTLAMIQKLQRDELNQYIENQKANGEQPISPLEITNLIGYNDIVNVIKNDARPEVKVAAIQALQYVAEPQDKNTVQEVLSEALNSKDEAVKAAADETMAKFNQ